MGRDASDRYAIRNAGQCIRAAIMPVHKLDGTGRRILVIDDDLAIRVLLHAVLKRLKFEVQLAEDGAAGLEMLQRGVAYDLILLDLMMPRLNGYEFIDEIGRRHPESRPHIVVFTAAGKRGVDKIPADAVCNSILKPFDLDTFIDIIADCLNRTHSTHLTQQKSEPSTRSAG
jgi:CheY-like chemotaxis protein